MNAQLFNYLLRITGCSIICLIYWFYNHKRSKEYQKTVDNLESQLENLEKERLELMREHEKLSHTINQTNMGTMSKIAQPLHKFPQSVEQISSGISDLKTALNKAAMDLNASIQTAQVMAALGGNYSVQEYNSIWWGLK